MRSCDETRRRDSARIYWRLQPALQRLDPVNQLEVLPLQSLIGRFQFEDVVFQQCDSHDQTALPLGRLGAEDVGEDLGGGSGICHGGRSWDLTRPELYQ